MAYVPRALEGPLRALATKYPIVTVTGPSQSGKSTLCLRRQTLVRGRAGVA